MTRCRKLSTTLMFLTATALVGMAVASAPALAAPQGGGPTVVTTDGPVPDARRHHSLGLLPGRAVRSGARAAGVAAAHVSPHA